MKIVILTLAALTIISGVLAAQVAQTSGADDSDERFMATVHVVAFETRGEFLGSPDVRVFESEDHKDLAGSFHAGVAEHVPFGIYRIEASIRGFRPELRSISVYQQQTTVVVGLELGHETLVLPVPPSLHGKIIGTVPPAQKSFVKLTGVYSSQSLESSIGSDGSFGFSVPTDGKYLLMVVSDNGVLATRTIDSPYTGAPLEIKVNREISTPLQ